MSSWRRFSDRSQLDRELAAHIARQLVRDIEERGDASLALSGGNTPRVMFQNLSHSELDWSRVTLTLVDERWVAGDSPDSNERMLRENLLQNRAAAAQLVSLKTEHDEAEPGLAEVQQRLARISRPFSAVVLGMGGDGHTASWFPRASNLQSLLYPENDAIVGASDPVTAPHQRITLTLPAVLDSREIIIHITGDDKQSVLEAAVSEGHPVAAVTAQKITPVTIWWAP